MPNRHQLSKSQLIELLDQQETINRELLDLYEKKLVIARRAVNFLAVATKINRQSFRNIMAKAAKV